MTESYVCARCGHTTDDPSAIIRHFEYDHAATRARMRLFGLIGKGYTICNGFVGTELCVGETTYP